MKLHGCLVAITTPFHADDTLDEVSLGRHAEWLVTNGVRGVVVCGTTGESATLTEDEKIRAMNVVTEAVGSRATVVGGAGNNSTRESTDFVQRVNRETRVDAIMSVVPYYNKPSQEGILAHFDAICRVSGFPVVLYNVPGRTVVGMSVETLARAARLPNVVALKEASGDLFADTLVLELLPDHVALLSGDDATAMPFLALGGAGVISVAGNVVPRWMSAMCSAVEQGDLSEARRWHRRIAHVHALMFSESSPVPAKIVVERLGFGRRDVRSPVVMCDDDRIESIVARARELEVLP
jgi:4-hydroxy-tetrahydrodipicolinate synthase